MMNLRVLIDIGSTYTKATAVDLGAGTVLATSRAPTTVADDVTLGLKSALATLEAAIGREIPRAAVTACSSAAGGLRMVSVGLVPELSSEAAKRAALGAGAKIVGHYCYTLNPHEVAEIEAIAPDVLLLAGGTDGGNERTIVHNARVLGACALRCHVVVAGNKCARDPIERAFAGSGLTATFADNVMPAVGTLEVQPCREAIRDVFLHHIVQAKGLDRARNCVSDIIMPTPVAVLEAAALLGNGCDGERGLGDLIVVDVGGATTDVYSIADGAPSSPGVALRGLPEPHAKRTVEGDLGVRYNIDVLAEVCRRGGVALDAAAVRQFHATPSSVPENEREQALDFELGRAAVATSFERHVGRLDTHYGPHGQYQVQTGKDLTRVTTVIGTGGPIIHTPRPEAILRGVLSDSTASNLLKPRSAAFYLDGDYLLYAVGLLARSEPQAALRIARRHLRRLFEASPGPEV
jgi:uncharacterized protein (TIGR01319 family)